MKLDDIIHCIEKTAPPHLAASWDNCGIQVASANDTVTVLALCLDPSPTSIAKALAIGAQCIISHHPLLMQGRLPNTLDHYHEVLRLLFTHAASLYAAHTSLDINPHGPAGWLAKSLQLKDISVLENIDPMPNGLMAGYGIVGQLPKPLSHEDFMHTLAQYIDLSTATLCGKCVDKPYTRIAYCTGSGSSLAHKAHAQNADIFITGDVKYHSALESPLCMLDVGHHSLEEEMMRKFALELAPQLSNVRVEFIASASPLRPAIYS